jgi:hypothetical protein
MSVGVMKDYKLKLRNLHASHTLGGREFYVNRKKMEVEKKRNSNRFGRDR